MTWSTPSTSNCPEQDDVVHFNAEYEEQALVQQNTPRWKVLIVDDEEDVHSTTRLVLRDVEFNGGGLQFFSAYSATEALKILQHEPDISVVLLDVVMETPHAGLHVVRSIREDLKNSFIRIILRTGQPGQAPERKVIVEYDINDYKQKVELTSQRLFTTVYTALRSYYDLRIIEQNRLGLRHIIDISANLLRIRSIRQLAHVVRKQLSSLYNIFSGSVYVQRSDPCDANNMSLELIAGTGVYEPLHQDVKHSVLPEDTRALIRQAFKERRSISKGHNYLNYFRSHDGREHLIYMKGKSDTLTTPDRTVVQLFTNSIALAFDNVYLHQEILHTQKEIILRLGDVLETRSKEAANHVRRVAEFTRVLGQAAGLDQDTANLYSLASPMHDVGKIAIPDSILLKPGALNSEERTIMQTHTVIGYQILNTSERLIMQTAATIAHEHHERWDGSGYPRGLKGEQIHIAGRITCLADIYDALMHKRVYKAAWHQDAVLQYIREYKGIIFDPILVDGFFDNFGEIQAIQEAYRDQSCTTTS